MQNGDLVANLVGRRGTGSRAVFVRPSIDVVTNDRRTAVDSYHRSLNLGRPDGKAHAVNARGDSDEREASAHDLMNQRLKSKMSKISLTKSQA